MKVVISMGRESGGRTAWGPLLQVLLLGLGAVVAMSRKDIARYMRLRNM